MAQGHRAPARPDAVDARVDRARARRRWPAAREDLREALDLRAGHRHPAGEPRPRCWRSCWPSRASRRRRTQLLDEFGVSARAARAQVMSVVLHFRARVRAGTGAGRGGARRRPRGGPAATSASACGAPCRRGGRWPPCCSPSAASASGRSLAEAELELAGRWGTPLGPRDRAARARAGHGGRRAARRRRRAAAGLALASRAGPRAGGPRRRAAPRRAAARTSREPLGGGMDLAHACGARPLAERARTELLATRRAAAPPRPQRRRLADPERAPGLRARRRGRTNRQIAQELFVTTATVETHLRHAFRKLGLRSAAGAAAVLGDSSG